MLTANPTTMIPESVKAGVFDGIAKGLSHPGGPTATRAVTDAISEGAESTWEIGIGGAEAEAIGYRHAYAYDVTGASVAELARAIAGHVCELFEADGFIPVTSPIVRYVHRCPGHAG